MARGADRRSGRPALRAGEHPRLDLDDGRGAVLTGRDGRARETRQQPRPTLAVEHADGAVPRVDGRPQRPGQLLAQQPVARRLGPQVHHRRRRPPGALVDGCRAHDRTAGERPGLRRRDRCDERHRRAGPARPLDRHVARVPGRRPLLLERLVTLVEHDDGREVRHRRPHRGAAADDDHVTRARRGPGAGALGVVAIRAHHQHPPAASLQVPHQRPEAGAVGDQHQRGALGGEPFGHQSPAVRGRRPREDLDREPGSRPGGHRGPRVAYGVRRRRGAEQHDLAPGPAVRGPAAEVEQVRGRSRTDDLGHGQDPLGRGPGCHAGRDDPAADAPAVERHAHDRADAQGRARRAGERIRDRVVELARDGGQVGMDPDDAPVVRTRPDRVPYRLAAAARRASAAPVCSHVNVGSARPKWP